MSEPKTLNSNKKGNMTSIAEIKERRGITNEVKVRKKSGLTKLGDVFLPGDVSNVKNFIVKEVIVPSIIKAIDTIITEGTHMMLYGEQGHKKSKSINDRISFREYTNYSSNSSNYKSDYRSFISKPTFEYEDIIFKSRGEAENVLMGLDDILATYNIVRVADFYELVGIRYNHTAMDYGWSDLRSASVIRTRDGYIIKLPRALAID